MANMPRGEKRIKVSGAASDLTWVFDEDGALHCSDSAHTPVQGTRAWCHHVEYVVRNNIDGAWCSDAVMLSVPVFPTRGMFAEVRIDETVIAGGRKIFTPYADGNHSSGLDFIGFLSPGEGRGVIRQMLLEWVVPKWRGPLDTEGATCKSRLHGYKAERDIAAKSVDPGYQGANIWSVVQDSVCLECMVVPDTDWGSDPFA